MKERLLLIHLQSPEGPESLTKPLEDKKVREVVDMGEGKVFGSMGQRWTGLWSLSDSLYV